MRRLNDSRLIGITPVLTLVVGVVLMAGVFQSFRSGAADFQVFHYAWQLVLSGKSILLYRDSPDRFLYAYPFAWWLSPLGLLSSFTALAVWNLFKLSLFGFSINRLRTALKLRLGQEWIVLLAVLFCARPLLNELRYGQFNLVILALGLIAWSSTKQRGVSLALFMVALAVKPVLALFGIPTLIFWAQNRDTRLKTLLIAAFIFLFPFVAVAVQQGGEATGFLVTDWVRAMADKGFPTETHNQSIAAIFHRVMSGESFRSLLSHSPSYFWGHSNTQVLSPLMVKGMNMGLSLMWVGLQLALGLKLLVLKDAAQRLKLALVLFTGALLPIHLVWKPYFVFLIPLLVVLFVELAQAKKIGRREITFYAIIFIALNFTTPLLLLPVFGAGAAIRIEALGLSMLVLVLLWLRSLSLLRRLA